MYYIEVDDEVIYSPLLADTNEKYAIESGVLDIEIDRAGSLTIRIPATNIVFQNEWVNYGFRPLTVLGSDVTLYDDPRDVSAVRVLFHGRPVTMETDYNNTVEVTCEGSLGWLNDVVIPPHTYPLSGQSGTLKGYYQYLLSYYNTEIGANNPAPSGKQTITSKREITIVPAQFPPSADRAEFSRSVDEYRTILENINSVMEDQNKLDADPYGNAKHVYIKWGKSGDSVASVLTATNFGASAESDMNNSEIQFGGNLIDFDELIDATDSYTRLIPLGSTDSNTNQPITVESIIGRIYIDYDELAGTPVSYDIMDKYGIITKVVEYSDIDNAQALYNKAIELCAFAPACSHSFH